MANKTEVLVHKGHDCSLWELVKETSESGLENLYIRCIASGDKIGIVALNSDYQHGVHWEDEELQLEHADKEE